jgi:prepilin-type N-terminal cleavage/methylation domain-containing protein
MSSVTIKKLLLSRGFTLVELTTSVAIMTIVLGITLLERPQATLRLALRDTVSSSELLFRTAQLEGSAIKNVNDSFGGAGVFLDRTIPNQLLMFKDRVDASIVAALGVGNGLYNSTPTDEKKEIINFLRGSKFTQLCVSTTSINLSCNSEELHLVPIVQNVTVSFNRPSPTANIYVNNNTAIKYSTLCVQFETLRAPDDGHVQSLFISRSGIMIKQKGACK